MQNKEQDARMDTMGTSIDSLTAPAVAPDAHTMETRIPFPFNKQIACSGGGEPDYYRWHAGVRWEEGYSDREAVADGIGTMVLVEIGRYTPPGFGERVFYTRQFIPPDGKPWGRPRLRVMGAAGFTRLRKGYRYPVELVDTLANVAMEDDRPAPVDAEDYADAARGADSRHPGRGLAAAAEHPARSGPRPSGLDQRIREQAHAGPQSRLDTEPEAAGRAASGQSQSHANVCVWACEADDGHGLCGVSERTKTAAAARGGIAIWPT